MALMLYQRTWHSEVAKARVQYSLSVSDRAMVFCLPAHLEIRLHPRKKAKQLMDLRSSALEKAVSWRKRDGLKWRPNSMAL